MEKLPQVEQEILDDLIADYGLPPDLVHELVELVLFKYSSLAAHGAKTHLKREVASAIEKAIANEEIADPAR